MPKIYVRFSAPGGKGYIPGTSKDKYRDNWIDVPEIAVHSTPSEGQARVGEIHVAHQHDKTSERFQSFAVNGVGIDKVIIEGIDDNGILFFRATMERASIISFNQSRGGHEWIVLVAGNTITEKPSFSPEGMKRIGLDAFDTLFLAPVAKLVKSLV